jgi:hypothetical protein
MATSPSPPRSHVLDIFRISQPTPSGFLAILWTTALEYYRARQWLLRWQGFLEANINRANLKIGLAGPDPYVATQRKAGIRAAFWRAIITDRIRGVDGTLEAPDDAFIDRILPQFTGEANPMSWGYWMPGITRTKEARTVARGPYCAQLFRVAAGQSLILSRNGYLGLGPLETQVGDAVCIVRGCNTPAELRLVAGKESAYRLVGNCYVHAIMDGSFAQSASRRNVEKLEIEGRKLPVPEPGNANNLSTKLNLLVVELSYYHHQSLSSKNRFPGNQSPLHDLNRVMQPSNRSISSLLNSHPSSWKLSLIRAAFTDLGITLVPR